MFLSKLYESPEVHEHTYLLYSGKQNNWTNMESIQDTK